MNKLSGLSKFGRFLQGISKDKQRSLKGVNPFPIIHKIIVRYEMK